MNTPKSKAPWLRRIPSHVPPIAMKNEQRRFLYWLCCLVSGAISLSARVKRPGEELVSKPAHLSIVEEPTADEVDAYERLLGDAMHGDGMLFVREDAVEAA
jgi:glucose-6-phosphate 1-dehydrogenase